jgi:hypothetical protein
VGRQYRNGSRETGWGKMNLINLAQNRDENGIEPFISLKVGKLSSS